MGNVYRLETTAGYGDENGPFYDATKNGENLLTRVRYSEAFAHIASLIEDDDRFQEVHDCEIDCETSGASVKKSKQRSGY
jgi:hypothetical protein